MLKVFQRKAFWLEVVAILLTIAMGGYFLCSFFTNKGVVEQQIRTVQLEYTPSLSNYLQDFEQYSIIEEENLAGFKGKLPFNEGLASSFDNVSFEEDMDYSQYKTDIESSFDLEKMQFTYTMSLLDIDGVVVDTFSTTTDAFVTEYGNLDAYIEVDGETYLLSEWRSKLAEETDNCLFGWLIAAFATIVVTYVVVAETAEQIKSKQNYSYNQGLEKNQKGVSKGNYITDQETTKRKGYNSGNYRFGFTNFSKVGCEVASVYNLLIALGKAEMLSTTIRNFEKWAIEFSAGWGSLGSNPREIYRYLRKTGISYTKYTSYTSFSKALVNKSNCHVIMSTWNSGGFFSGLHTYYIKKCNKTLLRSYNFIYDNAYRDKEKIDDFYNLTGDFIVGYIIAG